MIKIQGILPRKVYIACSGGVDSMAITDFLKKNHKVKLLFFNHGTETSAKAETFLSDFVSESKTKLSLEVGSLSSSKDKTESWEEYWRNQRYSWFNTFDHHIITGHHLDDSVETWIWSALNGNPFIIPYMNKNIMRPFLLNRKEEFKTWAERKNVNWIEDDSNSDTKYCRNFIRHELLPKALEVNPGLHKVIAKKVEKQFKDWNMMYE